MNCERFRETIVDDAPDRAALERHASTCRECALLLEEHGRLEGAVRAWKAQSPAPPAELETRIVAALAQASSPAGRGARVLRPRFERARPPLPRWAAIAALLLTALAVLALIALRGGGGELARAVRDAERAQASYAAAIAKLEVEARQVIDRATDPSTDPREAAILLSYRDRLHHLDAVIAEVRTFLDENPGHSGGHTVLLAAYDEKDALLRKVIGLPRGDES